MLIGLELYKYLFVDDDDIAFKLAFFCNNANDLL